MRQDGRVADQDLIGDIEQDALDDAIPVARALRKCVALGGRSGSAELRDWASRELQGYPGGDGLPEYRRIAAPLLVDGVTAAAQIRRQQISPSMLPDFAREHISEMVELRDGVGALEALLQHERIDLQPPMASELVRIMNSESQDPYQGIVSLYWGVSHAAVRGVLDQIRTALTRLVAELRAATPHDQMVPSAEAATQAVSVVVTGKRSRVSVTTAQASGSATAEVAAPVDHPAEAVFWTRTRKVGAFIVGTATVAGAVVALIEFVH